MSRRSSQVFHERDMTGDERSHIPAIQDNGFVREVTVDLHDFGPDGAQHVLQSLSDAHIGSTVHVGIYRDSLSQAGKL